jgi:hypothetical protein
MRNIIILLFILVPFFLFAQQGGGIRPSVIEYKDVQRTPCHEAPLLDSVEITCYIPGTNDTFRTRTDSAGELRIKHMPPGVYTMAAKVPGYLPSEYKGVIISDNKYTYLCFEMVRVPALDTKPKKRKSKHKS